MSYQEKNIVVTLTNFSLILAFYLFRVFQMVQSESFTSTNVFRLWGIIVLLAVLGTIIATIFTHIFSGIVHKIKTNEEPHIEDIQDERDQLIELKGVRVTYTVSSIGAALSMLTYVLGHPPLVMFTLLIFFGVLAQVVADIWKLSLYRKGF
jgi:hypothetical protein